MEGAAASSAEAATVEELEDDDDDDSELTSEAAGLTSRFEGEACAARGRGGQAKEDEYDSISLNVVRVPRNSSHVRHGGRNVEA